MKNTKNTKTNESGHGVAIGLGVATLAAAAAGAYFLYGSTKGPARRKALKSWTVKMKGDVMGEVEKMKELTEDGYHTVIDKVSARYMKMKDVDMAELENTIKTLKGHWKDIKKEVEGSVKKIKKA